MCSSDLQQNYLQAYSRYKQAATAAPDLAAPRFRMAYALMALQRFELAGPELQRGIRLDPQYPLTGESPEQVYGESNRLAAAALPQAVAAWVRQDIRNPDRLFLLGALLMINGDATRAKILLATAAEFGGPAEHLTAFLKLGNQPVAGAPQAIPADDQPPVPEAVEKLLNENKDWLPAKPLASRRAIAAGGDSVVRRGKTTVSGDQPESETKAPGPAPEPAVTVIPAEPKAEPKKAMPLKPGYVKIPKKGSTTETSPETTTEPTATEPSAEKIQPAAATAPTDESGPVIPIPGAAN